MIRKSDTVTRRELLHFFGRIAGAGSALSLLPGLGMARNITSGDQDIPHIKPSSADELILAEGLDYEVLLSWGDSINGKGDRFGFNNDYLAFLPFEDKELDGLLWVNHEDLVLGYFDTPFDPNVKTLADVQREMKDVGGSIVRIRKSERGWEVVADERFNRRLDANTEIPLISARPIRSRTSATGTFANCSGGVTPWRTILTCEENYHFFTGEVALKGGARRVIKKSLLGWERFVDMPPEHYGWVVEVNPFTGEAGKLTAMGRFAHESATVVQARDGRCVVYSGDDKTNECIYKFIAGAPETLEHGTLYVADTDNGSWLPLDIRQNEQLAAEFRDQTELLIRTREAARIVGGSPQDRPEDIEYDPISGAIFVALTKNLRRLRPYGSILKIEERDNDPLALEFTASTYITGGSGSGIACPDNLAFDPRGNLWISTDISSNLLNRIPYTRFANNGLFFVPMRGSRAGEIFQVASAPVAAELTGMAFSPDGRTLFLSVQHPGETARDIEHLTSHWPEGGGSRPRPSVVTISGPFMDKYSSI